MAFIPIPNGIQLCFHFVASGSIWQFCLTVIKDSGSVTNSDLDNVADIAEAWWGATLDTYVGAGNTLTQITATNMTSQGAAQVQEPVNTDGVMTGSNIPSGISVVISQRTALRGRSYRGRAYLAGQTVLNTNGLNHITTTYAANLVSAFTALNASLVSAGYFIAVASKQHNGVTTTPAAVNAVTAFVVDTQYDSQRRRLAGRGD
jgi:hypothetical protein